MSAVPPPESGRWITPPPMDDGASVWSGDQYAAVTEIADGRYAYSQYSAGPGYGSPDRATYGELGGYPRRANADYAGTYPYYANYAGADGDPSLPPYWPVTDRPVDGFAIAALVFGVIAVVPLGIGFGIAALRRMARGHRRGRGLAVAGLIVSVAWVVAATALVVPRYFGDHSSQRDSAGAISQRETINVLALRVGDCVQLPVELSVLTTVTAMPCSQPHNGQVYTAIQASQATFPGLPELEQAGLASCQAALPAFLGTGATTLHSVAFVPTENTWGRGDRTETCIVVDRAQQVTGDIRPHA